jgi:hypothetical protein
MIARIAPYIRMLVWDMPYKFGSLGAKLVQRELSVR